jgi:hypothetical protein
MDSAESSRLNKPGRDPESLSSSFKDLPKSQAPEQARDGDLAPDQSERVEAARRIRRTWRRVYAGIARSLMLVSIAVLTGIAASSAWQAYSGEAKQMARAWTLSLISSASQYFAQTESKAEQNGGNSTVPSTRESQQPSPTQNPAPLAPDMQSETMQQLKSMSDKLEKLTLAQEQMTKKMTLLQAVEQEIKQKISSAPAEAAVPLPPTPIDPKRKHAAQAAAPQQAARSRVLADWWVTGIRNGTVFVEGNDDIYQAAPGVPLPGLGLVKRIIHQDGRWAVVTAKGLIAAKRDRTYFDKLKELNIE